MYMRSFCDVTSPFIGFHSIYYTVSQNTECYVANLFRILVKLLICEILAFAFKCCPVVINVFIFCSVAAKIDFPALIVSLFLFALLMLHSCPPRFPCHPATLLLLPSLLLMLFVIHCLFHAYFAFEYHVCCCQIPSSQILIYLKCIIIPLTPQHPSLPPCFPQWACKPPSSATMPSKSPGPITPYPRTRRSPTPDITQFAGRPTYQPTPNIRYCNADAQERKALLKFNKSYQNL